MKRIFVYMGTRRGSASNSLKVINLLREEIDKITEEEIIYEVYTPLDIEINTCIGCCTCFSKGYCVMDSKDNFNYVKEKILGADFVIFVSPVYAHSVTGDMKIFIDRISYWLHLFKLAGKKSLAISISSTNGNDYVNGYLKKILEIAGTQVVGTLGVTIDGPCMLSDEGFLEETLPLIASKIIGEMNSKSFTTSREQEKFFLSMQTIYGNTAKNLREQSYEYNYWKNNGMFETDSLKNYGLRLNA